MFKRQSKALDNTRIVIKFLLPFSLPNFNHIPAINAATGAAHLSGLCYEMLLK